MVSGRAGRFAGLQRAIVPSPFNDHPVRLDGMLLHVIMQLLILYRCRKCIQRRRLSSEMAIRMIYLLLICSQVFVILLGGKIIFLLSECRIIKS